MICRNSFFLASLLIISSTLLSAKPYISIEGNTGAGKTTLIGILEKSFDAEIIHEPVEIWQNVNNSWNLLDIYLNNRARYSYTFLSYAAITFFEARLNNSKLKDFTFSERSAFSGTRCFLSLMVEENTISACEAYIFQEKFEWLAQKLNCIPDGIIYLKTLPETVLQRVNHRNRPEEAALGMEFFGPLHRAHENWLLHKKSVSPYLQNVPVLVLEGDVDFKNDVHVQATMIQQVSNFIETLKK